jgi:Protein of unknown function (DUF1329)
VTRSLWSRASACGAVLFLALVCLPSPAASSESSAAEDAATAPLREGETITFDQVERLRPFLPPELWPHRDFIFFEGMRLQIGPPFADYSPPEAFQRAGREHRGTARIGPDQSLEGYVAGEPFPIADIDCAGDPEAGAKIAWDFDYRWQGAGPALHGRYTYWDRGEELPLYYEAQSRTVMLSHRPEAEYSSRDGDLFRGEQRKLALSVRVDAPFDAKGIALITYRYKAADAPLAHTRNDDTWVYVPTLRRVRRISSYQRTDAVSGTDFTFDDLGGFNGIVPQYSWSCLGQQDVLATVNSQVKAYPYTRDHNFGPYGLSFADDRWELRHTLKIQFQPKNADHPYSKKVMYVDRNTGEILYSFAYDRQGELWKIIYHEKRWSEDAKDLYRGWDDVPEPRDDINVADVVINVQTGTGNRLEFWDANGTPLASGKIRRLIDVGSLTRGR